MLVRFLAQDDERTTNFYTPLPTKDSYIKFR